MRGDQSISFRRRSKGISITEYNLPHILELCRKYNWSRDGSRAYMKLAHILHSVAAGGLSEISDYCVHSQWAGWKGAVLRDEQSNRIGIEVDIYKDIREPVLLWIHTNFSARPMSYEEFAMIHGRGGHITYNMSSRISPVTGVSHTDTVAYAGREAGPVLQNTLWYRDTDWGILSKIDISQTEPREVPGQIFAIAADMVDGLTVFIQESDPTIVDIADKMGHKKPVLLKLEKEWFKSCVLSDI